MKFFIVCGLVTSIVLAFMNAVFWLFWVLFVLFSVSYSTAVLIPIAVVFDGYYGNFHTVPVLSVGAIVWFVITEFLQPKLVSFVQIKP